MRLAQPRDVAITARMGRTAISGDNMRHTKISFSSVLRGFTFAIMLSTPSLFAQQSARPSDVLGLAMVGHHVSDLERSIKFFEAIDFKLVEGPTAWKVDDGLNKLGNTPGAETRTATMRVQSSVSDVPFTLILRQYRAIFMARSSVATTRPLKTLARNRLCKTAGFHRRQPTTTCVSS